MVFFRWLCIFFLILHRNIHFLEDVSIMSMLWKWRLRVIPRTTVKPLLGGQKLIFLCYKLCLYDSLGYNHLKGIFWMSVNIFWSVLRAIHFLRKWQIFTCQLSPWYISYMHFAFQNISKRQIGRTYK